MYAHFYHLSENPFNLTPDPKYHYINESTREALAAVLYGIKSRKGFLTLIGEAGTGKTTLLRRIVDEIEGETRVVFVFNPGVSFDELLEYLCMELGIRTDPGGRLQLIERLNQYLLEQLTDGRNVVVIIDEAQTLEDQVLEELRMLSNLETSKEKILQIVLSGQPELEEKLRRPNLRQLRQRIGVRATLKPMRSDEIRAYVETRLRSAGGQKAELFTSAALLRCWKAAQGIPRVINVICDNAMMVAFAEGSDRITVSVMNAAIRDLDGQTQSEAWLGAVRDALSGPGLRYAAAAVVVIGLAFALGRGLTMNDEGEMPPERIALAPPASPPPAAQHATPPAAAPVPAAVAKLNPPTPTSTPPSPAPAAVAPPPPTPTYAVPEPVNPTPPPASPVAAAPPPMPVAPAPPRDVVYGGETPPAVGANAEALRNVEPSAPPRPASATLLTPEPAPAPPAESPEVAEAVKGSVKRAEDAARSTAARLYGGNVPEPEPEPVRPAPRQLASLPKSPEPPTRVPEPVVHSSEPVVKEPVVREPVVREPVARAPEPEVRPTAEAAALAAEVLRNPPTGPLAATQKPGEAPPSSAAAPTGLAGGLETVASLSGGAARAPKAGEKPVVGRHVRVTRGDTVWAIAMQYYGTVDSSVLTEIFKHNPGIRNAHQLPVGTSVFVPFLKPEHMIDPVQGGGYRVLVAESPEAAEIAKASSWAASRLPGRELRTASKGKDNPVRTVYATGFTGREAALTAARQLLGPASQ